MAQLGGEEPLGDGWSRAETLADNIRAVRGTVSSTPVALKEFIEGEAVAELGILRLLEAKDDLAGFDGEPARIGRKIASLFKEGFVDIPGEVPQGTHWKEECGAVPYPFEER